MVAMFKQTRREDANWMRDVGCGRTYNVTMLRSSVFSLTLFHRTYTTFLRTTCSVWRGYSHVSGGSLFMTGRVTAAG